MVDIFNNANLPATNPTQSQDILDKLQKEADLAKYGPQQKADKLAAMADNAQEKMAKGRFTNISEVLVQLELMATAKAAAMNAKIDAHKDKIENSKTYTNLA